MPPAARRVFVFHLGFFIAFVLFFVIEALIAVYVDDAFVRPYVGDVLVVGLVYCAARTVLARRIPWLPWWVFLFAAAVEAGQYFDLIGRLGLRESFVARAVLGVQFDWRDILCYFVGCLFLALFEKIAGRNDRENKCPA